MQVVPTADCIFYIKGLITEDLCQTIIGNFHRDSRKRPGCIVSGQGEMKPRDEVKVSTDLEIAREWPWTAAYDELDQAVRSAIKNVVTHFPSLQIWPLWWTGYKIQHYRKGAGHFKWHFDALGPGTWDRQMAMIIYLNSVEDGGETCFDHQNLQVKPVAGDALLFPTFWTHAHCGNIPRSEDKYIISSFISFAIPATEQRPAA
jgi:hypothetical protein